MPAISIWERLGVSGGGARRATWVVVVVVLMLELVGCATADGPARVVADAVRVEEHEVELGAGRVTFDLYVPRVTPAPLVVVAHGFLRGKSNMAGWGRRLAEEGFAAAVPTLPTTADHERNGRSMVELAEWLCGTPGQRERIDAGKIGMMGFSAGGLSSLLAAAAMPRTRIWVGLDPVDRDGLGVAAAGSLQGRAVILRAEPSAWNASGNARDLEQALKGRCESVLIPGAVHVDAEWPTDFWAELVVGSSDEGRRGQFVEHAVRSLKAALTGP
jgi:dienelactone hydrolase